MKLRRSFAVTAAAGLAVLLVAPSATAAPTARADQTLGNRSLAAVLTANGGGQFDSNPFDYDILTQAVLAVVKAKPNSNVALLENGNVALTAFLPSDFAFRDLARKLTGKYIWSEKDVFNTLVSTLGVDTIEAVLLYHVIPGATIDSKTAVNSNGVSLATALPGASIKVQVVSKWLGLVKLDDADTNAPNPYLNPFALNINKGNKQIAHGITAVLRPVDLP